MSVVNKEVLVSQATPITSRFDYFVDESGSVRFTNRSRGSAIGYLWSFGDTSAVRFTQQRDSLEKQYQDGRYTACLTALAADGRSHMRCHTFEVNTAGEETCKAASHGLRANFAHEELEQQLKVSGYPVDFVGISHGDAAKIRWEFGDGSVDSTTQSPTHYYQEPGNYTACYTVEDPFTGMSDRFCESIQVGSETSIESIATATFSSLLSLYPVPATDYLTIDYDVLQEGRVILYLVDAVGSVVDVMLMKDMKAGANTLTIEVGKYPTGKYSVVLQTETTRQVRGFIKE